MKYVGPGTSDDNRASCDRLARVNGPNQMTEANGMIAVSGMIVANDSSSVFSDSTTSLHRRDCGIGEPEHQRTV